MRATGHCTKTEDCRGTKTCAAMATGNGKMPSNVTFLNSTTLIQSSVQQVNPSKMHLLNVILLCILLAFQPTESKSKSSKLKDKLAKAEKQPAKTRNDREEVNYSRRWENFQPGFQSGHVSIFTHVYKTEFLRPEEAVSICEADPSCAGFTFLGIGVPGKSYEIKFLHHLGYRNHRFKKTHWTTYKAKKNYVILNGKPEVRFNQIGVKNVQALLESQTQTWPFDAEKIMAVSQNEHHPDEISGQSHFSLTDHNFKSAGWKTMVNLNMPDESTAAVSLDIGGHTRGIKVCCTPYNTTLKNINFRFTPQIHDNIKTLQCSELTREYFQENFVQTKTPLKIVGCPEDFTKEKFIPDDLAKDDWIPNLVTKSPEGQGLIMKRNDYMDEFHQQILGTRWWVITPPGSVFNNHCKYCSPKATERFDEKWAVATWFDNIQPQLAKTKIFGREVIQTMQKPGDILYIPSLSIHTYYAVENSIGLKKALLITGDLEFVDSSAADFVDSAKVTNPHDLETLEFAKEYWAKFDEEREKHGLTMTF